MNFFISFLLLLILGQCALAQSSLPLTAGKVLVGRIDIDSRKKIPLPEGRWVVMGLHTRQTPLTGGSKASETINYVSLMNDDENAPFQYLSLNWSLYADVNWTSQPCDTNETYKSKPKKDTFNTHNSSIVVKCVAAGYRNSGDLNSPQKYNADTPLKKELWLPIVRHSRSKPMYMVEVNGYVSKHRNDLFRWSAYVNPYFYGLVQPTDTQYLSPSNSRQMIADKLLDYAMSWNKHYLDQVEKEFFPGLFQSASQPVDRFNFQERVEDSQQPPVASLPQPSTSNAERERLAAKVQVESKTRQEPEQQVAATPNSLASKAPRPTESPRPPLSLTISFSEPDANGVITFSITTNGDTASLRVNGDEEGSSADGRYNVRRFAQIGETQFEVIATDRFGNTKKQKVSVFRDAVASTVKFPPLNPSNVRTRPATNAVAIIIGIQDYRRVPKAEFANNDARLFYDYAVRGLGVKPENIKLLLDQEADDVGILGAIQNWLPLKARKGQTDVYVFYSGHGLPSDDGGSLYLLPHGVDRQFLDRTAIKQSELVSALQAANPKSVTLFMDACYSGQIRTGETLLASARPIVIAPRASTFPSNFTVITASAPDQLASSSPDLKHGIFSYYLMKGMEGEADQNKDGVITVQEMQSYLSDSVGRKAMSLSRTQQPQVVGDQSRVLVGR